jgi:O-antigen ligase
VGPAVLCLAVLVVPLVYVPALDSPFLESKLALLLVAGALGLGGALAAWAAGRALPRWPRPLGAAVVAVAVTAVAAAVAAALRAPVGAPYAAAELARGAAILGVAFAAAEAARDARWRGRLTDAIQLGAGLVSLIGLGQHVRLLPFTIPVISLPGSTFGNRNMAAEAIAMSVPFGLAALLGRAPASSRPLLPAVLLFVDLLFLAATRARGAWLGVGLGVLAFLAVRRPKLSRAGVFAALPLGAALLLAAIVPGTWSRHDSRDTKRFEPGARVVLEALDPASPVARTRLGLWRRTLAMYAAHPLLGVGPGNFPILFPLYAEPGASADGVMSANVIPRRPHDEPLERLAETGPFGLAALLAFYLAAFVVARRLGAELDGPSTGEPSRAGLSAAAAGSLAAGFGCGLVAFPLAMPETALLAGVALGLLAEPGATEQPATRPGAARAAAIVLAAVLVGAAAIGAARGVAASYFVGRAERVRDRMESLSWLGRAETAAWGPARFWIALRTAQLSLRLGDAPRAEAAAHRALEREPYSPHAWALRGAARLRDGDASGAAADARRALVLYAEHPGAKLTLAAAAPPPKGP